MGVDLGGGGEGQALQGHADWSEQYSRALGAKLDPRGRRGGRGGEIDAGTAKHKGRPLHLWDKTDRN